MAEPDGVPLEAWIRLGAVQENVRIPIVVGKETSSKGYAFQQLLILKLGNLTDIAHLIRKEGLLKVCSGRLAVRFLI